MKLKDYVTLGNLLSGLGAIVALFHHEFQLAGYLIIAAYFFDMFDGIVARLTKQYNKFGAELDSLCDFVSYAIAPGFLVYYAFHEIAHYPIWAAIGLMFLPIAIGTVRAARFNVRRAEFKGFFIGMPRTVFAMVMVALFNSAVFHSVGPLLSGYMYLIPVALVIVISFQMISLRPYVGHHDRRFRGWLRFGMVFWLASVPIGFVVGLLVGYHTLVFDVILFDMMIYTLLTPFVTPKSEIEAYWKYIQEWKAMGETQ